MNAYSCLVTKESTSRSYEAADSAVTRTCKFTWRFGHPPSVGAVS